MKFKDEPIRSICVTGNKKAQSYYITIPKRIVNRLKLKPKQKVTIDYFEGLIIIDPKNYD